MMKGYADGRLLLAGASPFGVTLAPMQYLHYALTRPTMASALAGYNTPEHVDTAMAYETASEEEKNYATTLSQTPVHAYYGQCTYCGYCTPYPMGTDIVVVNKLYDLALMQNTVPATIKARYDSLSSNSSDCIGCRGCKERCPSSAPVSGRMARAGGLFQQI